MGRPRALITMTLFVSSSAMSAYAVFGGPAEKTDPNDAKKQLAISAANCYRLSLDAFTSGRHNSVDELCQWSRRRVFADWAVDESDENRRVSVRRHAERLDELANRVGPRVASGELPPLASAVVEYYRSESGLLLGKLE